MDKQIDDISYGGDGYINEWEARKEAKEITESLKQKYPEQKGNFTSEQYEEENNKILAEILTNLKQFYPSIYKKIDTLQKVKILLNAANVCEVNVHVLEDIAESILRRHERGETRITFTNLWPYERGVVEKLAYYMQVADLNKLLFPDLKSGGTVGNEVFFDWSSESISAVAPPVSNREISD